MVINIGKLLSRQFQYVETELLQMAKACHESGAILKVIFENAYLTDDLKIIACKICKRAEVDFVKTSTGFAPTRLHQGRSVADEAHCEGRLPGEGRRRASARWTPRWRCTSAAATASAPRQTAKILDEWKARHSRAQTPVVSSRRPTRVVLMPLRTQPFLASVSPSGLPDPARLMEHARREAEAGERFLEFRLDYLPAPEAGVRSSASSWTVTPTATFWPPAGGTRTTASSTAASKSSLPVLSWRGRRRRARDRHRDRDRRVLPPRSCTVSTAGARSWFSATTTSKAHPRWIRS